MTGRKRYFDTIPNLTLEHQALVMALDEMLTKHVQVLNDAIRGKYEDDDSWVWPGLLGPPKQPPACGPRCADQPTSHAKDCEL